MMDKKGQSSIEFMIFFIIFMVAIVASLFVSVERSHNLIGQRLALESTKLMNDVSNKINTAYLEGNGFQINLTVPTKIYGRNFTIGVYSNLIRIELEEQTYFKTILTDNITGNLDHGINLIRNIKGVILIS